ncbi:MAG: cytochrome c oxidase assembly protein [Alphaproteobacteria bacterium]
MNKNDDDTLVRKNIRTGLVVSVVVISMIGMSFAAVPLYGLFCKVTGFGGTTREAENLPDRILNRTVAVRFNADTDRALNWVFKPEMNRIDVKLGARGYTAYSAYNRSAQEITGTAVYNVTPLKAGKYFNKIECFCFGEQVLQPGEQAALPVIFYIDPALADNPDMDDVDTITLSYTFYKAGSKALEQGLEDTYNTDDGKTR